MYQRSKTLSLLQVFLTVALIDKYWMCHSVPWICNLFDDRFIQWPPVSFSLKKKPLLRGRYILPQAVAGSEIISETHSYTDRYYSFVLSTFFFWTKTSFHSDWICLCLYESIAKTESRTVGEPREAERLPSCLVWITQIWQEGEAVTENEWMMYFYSVSALS